MRVISGRTLDFPTYASIELFQLLIESVGDLLLNMNDEKCQNADVIPLTLAYIHADDYFRIQAAQLATYTNQSLVQVTQQKAPLQPGQMLLILPGRPIKDDAD